MPLIDIEKVLCGRDRTEEDEIRLAPGDYPEQMLMLALLFDGLDAAEATTGAFADSPASNAVSRKVGYYDDGMELVDREGVPAKHNRYRMPRDRWLEVRAVHAAHLAAPIILEGTKALRDELDQAITGPAAEQHN